MNPFRVVDKRFGHHAMGCFRMLLGCLILLAAPVSAQLDGVAIENAGSYTHATVPEPDVAPEVDSGTIDTRSPVFGFQYSDWEPTWTQVWINRNGQHYDSYWILHEDLIRDGERLLWTIPEELPAGDYAFWMRGWNSNQGLGSWNTTPGTFRIFIPVPQAVTLLAPNGEQRDTDLTFTWEKDADATYYQVHIQRGAQQAYQRWHEMSGTGTAALSLTGFVEGSTYSWWVRPWGPGGLGEWSDAMTFNIRSPETAEMPVLVSPSGQIASRQPIFSWERADHASWYRIYVQNRDTGQPAVDGWVESNSATSSQDLPLGNYRWWVGSWNPVLGRTVWSEPLDFTIGVSGYLYNITLTWLSTPRDLDSHLLVPNGSHIYFASRGAIDSAPFAQLDVDDTQGYGPENIAIYQAYEGIYRYYVHQYSTDGNLAGSGARVRIIDADGHVLYNRIVPDTGTGRYWHVFDLNAETGQLTVIDEIRTTAPSH